MRSSFQFKKLPAIEFAPILSIMSGKSIYFVIWLNYTLVTLTDGPASGTKCFWAEMLFFLIGA